MHPEITNELEKTMFTIYKENYPTIFLVVDESVKNGYTPTQIKKFFAKKFPTDRLQLAHISLVASYLFKQKLGTN